MCCECQRVHSNDDNKVTIKLSSVSEASAGFFSVSCQIVTSLQRIKHFSETVKVTVMK